MPRNHHLTAVRTLLAVGLSALLIAGCSSADDTKGKTPAATATPTTSPAEEAIAPLLDLEEVDVAALPLPKPPDGVDPAVWEFNAVSVRKLAEASTDSSLWDATAGTGIVIKVAAAAFQTIEQSMVDSVRGSEPAQSLFWGPVFAPDEQPTDARVIDARWTNTKLKQGGKSLDTAVIELTTVYTLPEDRHVVITRKFLQGTSRPVPNIGTYRWGVDSAAGGYDACRYYTDAVIASSDSPDLTVLQELVDHVVEQSAIDTTVEDSDIAAERKKACANV